MSARTRRVLTALLLSVGLIAVIASGSTNKAEKVDSSKGSSESSTDSESFGVGDEVKLGDWTVKVWGVTDPYTSSNEFLKPSDGNRWVLLDTEVKNVGSDPNLVSSLMCFKLKDSANREYDEDIASGTQPGPPDGEVAPGSSTRGNIVFEIPADATGLQLEFKCELFDSGTATIQLP